MEKKIPRFLIGRNGSVVALKNICVAFQYYNIVAPLPQSFSLSKHSCASLFLPFKFFFILYLPQGRVYEMVVQYKIVLQMCAYK